MEISESTISIFYLSKILGLAPFSLKRNSKGALEIQRSVFFTFYTLALCLIMVFLTYRGLLFDANSEIPIRPSFRMKSATSKVVTALDVSVVVLATVAGTFCSLLGFKSFRELNSRIKKIDDSLHSYTNFKRDRIRSILMIVLIMGTIVTLLALDIMTWLQFAISMQANKKKTELNVQWYIPFYSLYLILTGLHIFFANTAFGISRRFNRLNLLLKNTFLIDKKKESHAKTKITTVKALGEAHSNLNASLNKVAGETKHNEGKCKGIIIRLMAENHESLCKCVTIISSSYGIAVLFILVSCLLHLVATAYFLFLEVLSKKYNNFLWLQVLWILFHIFRLLLVVEPCHLATKESRKTILLICEIERKEHDPILSEEIKKFWQQLLILHATFSANGLCKVNRNILTSFSSAIATYLVILIQFQRSNG